MTRLLALAILLTTSAPGVVPSPAPRPEPERASGPEGAPRRPDAAAFAGPVRVIDADTIDVGEVRVRLHGIDAAEAGQTCERDGVEWACGDWATERVRALFEGRRANCERLDTDRYGRTVARCAVLGVEAIAAAKEGPGRVEAAPGGAADMGAQIVGRGLAVAYLRYSDDYAPAEAGRARGPRGRVRGLDAVSRGLPGRAPRGGHDERRRRRGARRGLPDQGQRLGGRAHLPPARRGLLRAHDDRPRRGRAVVLLGAGGARSGLARLEALARGAHSAGSGAFSGSSSASRRVRRMT